MANRLAQSLKLLLPTLLLSVSFNTANADNSSAIAPVSYVEIYADKDGETHMRDGTIGLTNKNYVPPASPLAVSKSEAAKAVVFLSMPPGWVGTWHSAPAHQYVIILSGAAKVEVSDGEVRLRKAGTVVLATDVTGKGHLTRTVGDQTVVLVAIPLVKAE